MEQLEIPETIEFVAWLPDVLSAIELPGDPTSGARIKLDVPASDLPAVMLLKLHGAGRIMHITVRIEKNASRTLSGGIRRKQSSVADDNNGDAVIDDGLDKVFEEGNGDGT
jgi:hypothetical protein